MHKIKIFLPIKSCIYQKNLLVSKAGPCTLKNPFKKKRSSIVVSGQGIFNSIIHYQTVKCLMINLNYYLNLNYSGTQCDFHTFSATNFLSGGLKALHGKSTFSNHKL